MSSVLLIDGYNLIWAANITAEGPAASTLAGSRGRMLSFLLDFLSEAESSRTTVVFDAAQAIPGLPRSAKFRGVQIHFATDHDDADALLEELIVAHPSPRRLTVVSSDHRVQNAARRRRATAIDSDVWFRARRGEIAARGASRAETERTAVAGRSRGLARAVWTLWWAGGKRSPAASEPLADRRRRPSASTSAHAGRRERRSKRPSKTPAPARRRVERSRPHLRRKNGRTSSSTATSLPRPNDWPPGGTPATLRRSTPAGGRCKSEPLRRRPRRPIGHRPPLRPSNSLPHRAAESRPRPPVNRAANHRRRIANATRRRRRRQKSRAVPRRSTTIRAPSTASIPSPTATPMISSTAIARPTERRVSRRDSLQCCTRSPGAGCLSLPSRHNRALGGAKILVQ